MSKELHLNSHPEEDGTDYDDGKESENGSELSDSYRYQNGGDYHSKKLLLVMPPDDAVDDRSQDDPYVYSDDNGSLSDAYFFPQTHDGVLVTEYSDSENDSKQPTTTYGSLGQRHPPTRHRGLSSPDISLGGTTLSEDEPITQSSPLVPNSSVSARRSSRHSKAHRNHRRRIRRQLQEQRERAVTQIRGKPQPVTTHHDSFWAALFILQLFIVFGCAFRYGCSLIQPSSFFHQLHRWSDAPDNSVGVRRRLAGSPRNKTALGALSSTSSRTYFKDNTTVPPMTFNSTTAVTPKDLKSLQDDDSFQPEGPKKISGRIGTSSSGSSTSPSTGTDQTSQQQISSAVTKNAPLSIDFLNVIELFIISGAYACITAYLSFGFMLIVERSLIPIMLVFTIILALVWGVLGLILFPYRFISFFGFSFLTLSLGYAAVCWKRIPFCSINLYTAICAMRKTTAILLVGFGSLGITLLWCLVWASAVMGIFTTENSTDCSDCETHVNIMTGVRSIELGFLIFSLYWTTMVIKNIVRVIVAGAIGAWWFAAPRQYHCCSCDSTVWGPLVRSCTSSLGSICFGSLVVFPAQAISFLGSCCCFMMGARCRFEAFVTNPTRTATEGVNNEQKDSEGGDPQDCFANEICRWIDPLARQLRCCNRWAYTYIGMYGYSFAQGGEKAIQLFETREWMDIARDNLIQNVLLMASIVIGGSAGIFSVLVEEADGYTLTSLGQPILTAFWIGSILGFVLSNILLLGVVGSAVNTILVCFAADPFEFAKNHPRLSRGMREVWSQQVWEPTEETL